MMYDPDKAINELYEETETLKAELQAHRENEGNECPLCALEEENWALRELIIQLRGLTDEQIDSLLADTQEKRDCHTVECGARLLANMDCICGFADTQDCEHLNAVSAVNEVIQNGMYCPDCKSVFADTWKGG